MKSTLLCVAPPLAACAAVWWLTAAEPAVSTLVRQANGEVLLTSETEAGAFYRIETSPDFLQWTPLVTVRSTGENQFLDVATPRLDRRYYRAVPLAGTSMVTGDHPATADGDAPVGLQRPADPHLVGTDLGIEVRQRALY